MCRKKRRSNSLAVSELLPVQRRFARHRARDRRRDSAAAPAPSSCCGADRADSCRELAGREGLGDAVVGASLRPTIRSASSPRGVSTIHAESPRERDHRRDTVRRGASRPGRRDWAGCVCRRAALPSAASSVSSVALEVAGRRRRGRSVSSTISTVVIESSSGGSTILTSGDATAHFRGAVTAQRVEADRPAPGTGDHDKMSDRYMSPFVEAGFGARPAEKRASAAGP